MTQQQSSRRRRLIGMGFVIAFVLSTATIIYTGLNVRAPGSHRTQQPAESAEPAVQDEPEDAVPQTAADETLPSEAQ